MAQYPAKNIQDKAFKAVETADSTTADSMFDTFPKSPSGHQQWNPDEISGMKKNIYEIASDPRSALWNEPDKLKNMQKFMDTGYVNQLSQVTSVWNKDDGKSMGWSMDNPDPEGERLDTNVSRDFSGVIDKKMRFDANTEETHLMSGFSNWFNRGGGKDLPQYGRKDRYDPDSAGN